MSGQLPFGIHLNIRVRVIEFSTFSHIGCVELAKVDVRGREFIVNWKESAVQGEDAVKLVRCSDVPFCTKYDSCQVAVVNATRPQPSLGEFMASIEAFMKNKATVKPRVPVSSFSWSFKL